MSPFVRRAVAISLPKCYKSIKTNNSLDGSQKEALMEILELLFKDQSEMVLGSAVYALDLISPSKNMLIKIIYNYSQRILENYAMSSRNVDSGIK
jgi:vesicle coat complex subunit